MSDRQTEADGRITAHVRPTMSTRPSWPRGSVSAPSRPGKSFARTRLLGHGLEGLDELPQRVLSQVRQV